MNRRRCGVKRFKTNCSTFYPGEFNLDRVLILRHASAIALHIANASVRIIRFALPSLATTINDKTHTLIGNLLLNCLLPLRTLTTLLRLRMRLSMLQGVKLIISSLPSHRLALWMQDTRSLVVLVCCRGAMRFNLDQIKLSPLVVAKARPITRRNEKTSTRNRLCILALSLSRSQTRVDTILHTRLRVSLALTHSTATPTSIMANQGLCRATLAWDWIRAKFQLRAHDIYHAVTIERPNRCSTVNLWPEDDQSPQFRNRQKQQQPAAATSVQNSGLCIISSGNRGVDRVDSSLQCHKAWTQQETHHHQHHHLTRVAVVWRGDHFTSTEENWRNPRDVLHWMNYRMVSSSYCPCSTSAVEGSGAAAFAALLIERN